MLEERLQNVRGWIDTLLQRFPEAIQEDVVIFGSAAIALNGYQMKDAPRDLDLFVSAALFDRLQKEGFKKLPHNDIFKIEIEPDLIDAFDEFNGMSFEKVKAGSKTSDHSRMVRFADIEDIKEWESKRNSEKGRRHLEEIENLEKLRLSEHSRRGD